MWTNLGRKEASYYLTTGFEVDSCRKHKACIGHMLCLGEQWQKKKEWLKQKHKEIIEQQAVSCQVRDKKE